MKEKEYYDKEKNWNFSEFEIVTESLTNWDFFDILNEIATKDSKILDLGTGGGEKLLGYFPKCAEIIGTDYSEGMIETALKNLELSGRENVTFRVMDNLKMDVPNNYFDIVVARNTVTDPKQIMKCLKKGGYLLIQGVDKYDCWDLKLAFGKGQGYLDIIPISIVDYENVLNAGFSDVELIPIYKREYFKNERLFKEFLEKVPIISSFGEEYDINQGILNNYIKENTYNGKIKLLRRYYGIIARKNTN